MKIPIRAAAFLLIGMLGHAPAAGKELDLSGQGSLREVFEAGLHPRNVPGLERRKCEIGRESITFVLPNGVRIPVDAKTTSFTVNRDDLLVELQAQTDYLTEDEAREMMLPILRALGEDADALESHLAAAANDDLLAHQGFGMMGYQTDAIRCSFGIGGGVSKLGKPFRFIFTTQWNRPNSRIDHREKAIEPPVGFKHLSMDPIPHGPADPEPTKPPPPDPGGDRPADRAGTDEADTGVPWFALICGSVGLLGILVIVFRLLIGGAGNRPEEG